MKYHLIMLLSVLCLIRANSQKLTKVQKTTLEEVDELKTLNHEMCQLLWDYSETALKEYKSAELLANILEKEGFSIKEDVAGMPTAFVATYGSGSPKIGILAEYDALPGIGNTTDPNKTPRKDGIIDGHGCGHNLFGAACTSAAIAIKKTLEKNNIKGTIVLFGTPAEETVVGKVYMAKEGVFDGMDAVLEWHPGQENEVSYNPSIAMNNFEVEFFGQSAHGAADPWNGRSALDAVEVMNYSVNLMREHIRPTARIHYVIPNGGLAPNVVPDYAKVWYYVRDTSRTNVEEYYERIMNIVEGASLATNTTYKVQLITGVHAYNLNQPLLRTLEKNMKLIGVPQFTEKEQAWARKLQESAGKEQVGFKTELEPMPEKLENLEPGGGSTDVAEVSFIAPTAGFSVVTAPDKVPWHSWATAASHGTIAGFNGSDVASKILAVTGIELFTSPKLLAEAKDYFMMKTGGKPYQSPLPIDQKIVLPE